MNSELPQKSCGATLGVPPSASEKGAKERKRQLMRRQMEKEPRRRQGEDNKCPSRYCVIWHCKTCPIIITSDEDSLIGSMSHKTRH